MSEDKQAVNKLWLGAGQVGLGLGTLGLILKMLQDSARRQEADSPDGANDMVLKIHQPGKNQKGPTEKRAFLTQALLAAGVTGGTLIAIDRIASRIQQKRLKREVSELDDLYDAGLESMKTAADDPNAINPDWSNMAAGTLFNLPAHALILSILAGGAATYATLAKSFPKKKFKPLAGGKYPRRVVIEGYGTLTPDGKADGPLVDPSEKAASFTVDREDFVKAASLLFVSLADAAVMSGDRSTLADMACRVPLLKEASDVFVDAILDSPDMTPEWASLKGPEKLEKAAAVLEDPVLSPVASRLLQSAFFAAEPEMSKASRAIAEHPEASVLLVKAASLMADLDHAA